MRCSSCREPGSATQPVSCPWVAPTRCRTPASRRAGASSPSGAAAPKKALSQPCRRARSTAARAVARVGQQHAGGPPDDRVGQRGVVRRRPRGVRGQDDDRLRRPAGQQGRDEGLDAALPRREVVGDDQCPGHGRSSRSQSCARATRSAAVGCEPKNHCQAAGGSGSERLVPARSRCIADERVRVAGEVEGVHVGAGLDVPGHEVLQRAWTPGCRPRSGTGRAGRSAGRPASPRPTAGSSGGAGQQPAERRHAGRGPERAHQGAGEDVVGRRRGRARARRSTRSGRRAAGRAPCRRRRSAGSSRSRRRRRSAPSSAGSRRTPARPAPGCRSAPPGPAGRCAAARPASARSG